MKKIGIALGGGAARASVHIGILKALQTENIPISYISGISCGAAVAAGFAVGNLKYLEENASKIKNRNLIKAADFLLSRQGFFTGRQIKKIFNKITLV